MIDLAHALTIAIEAAREAGALLRAEFHRPDGPRMSSADHAEVDEEAESSIRATLLEAFPETGFWGEETRGGGAVQAAYRWEVDPNDGTAAYLKGWRGSAISIALIHEGLPILGVVYAPLAPDDEGDLIAWAEGEPLTRNGTKVERAPLPAALGDDHVVLSSQDADRNAAGNAACCAPARFRAMPSIAYRLALVAVGEGEAAISLNGPTSYDVAGGHALLLAVGGELINEWGEPIRYDRFRSGSYFFGGSLAVAQELAGRPWSSVFEGGDGAHRSLVRPERGRAIADAGLLGRAQGVLLGQLAGDALGSMVEFRSARTIAQLHPHGLRELGPSPIWRTLAGQPTDDSELALSLARTLVSPPPGPAGAGPGGGEARWSARRVFTFVPPPAERAPTQWALCRRSAFDIDAILASHRDWLHSDPFDVGNTCRLGLEGTPVDESQANGALMRVSPLGIFGHGLPADELASVAQEEAALTHPHPVCRDASAAFAVAIAHAVRNGASARQTWEAACAWARQADAHPDVIATLEAAEAEPPADYQHLMGWVRISLQNAFYQLLHAPTLEEGVVRTVMAGGDTDTNGAIAGALLGAVHGRDSIPMQWRRMVLTCRAHGKTRMSRPASCWPVDALELAERLLMSSHPGAASGAPKWNGGGEA